MRWVICPWNVIERAAILAWGPVVDVSEALVPVQMAPPSIDSMPVAGAMTLEECERRHIRRTLDEVNWVIGGKQGAAEILGVPSSTLRSRMKKLGIEGP